MSIRYFFSVVVTFFAGGLLLGRAQSSFTVIHTFTVESATSPYTNSDGSFPRAGLIQAGGVLYGTASQGGSFGRGTVFSLSTNGTAFSNLHSFNLNDGMILYAPLVLSGNTLYGAAMDGGSAGAGTIFSIHTNGTAFTVLHNFQPRVYYSTLNTYTNNDGAWPKGGLVLSGNTLYGTTSLGGLFGNGTVFAIQTDGSSFTNLHNFTASYPVNVNNDGAAPHAGLVLSGNTLYGTTSAGGTAAEGTVFSLNTNGTDFTNLHNFTQTPNYTNSDGGIPQAGLVLENGRLYGTTVNGGAFGQGTVFCLSTNGTGFTTLHDFNSTNTDGFQANGDLIISGNTLFGTTQFGGSSLFGAVFNLNTDGTGFTILHNFTSAANNTNADGSTPQAGLILSGSTLYGAAAKGGAGYGTIFALNMAPGMKIAPAKNQIVVSWPGWASHYGLQTTTNLFLGSWSDVTSGVTTNSVGYVFTNTLGRKTAFFRLKSK